MEHWLTSWNGSFMTKGRLQIIDLDLQHRDVNGLAHLVERSHRRRPTMDLHQPERLLHTRPFCFRVRITSWVISSALLSGAAFIPLENAVAGKPSIGGSIRQNQP